MFSYPLTLFSHSSGRISDRMERGPDTESLYVMIEDEILLLRIGIVEYRQGIGRGRGDGSIKTIDQVVKGVGYIEKWIIDRTVLRRC